MSHLNVFPVQAAQEAVQQVADSSKDSANIGKNAQFSTFKALRCNNRYEEL